MYRAAGHRPIPCPGKVNNVDGSPSVDPPRWPLAIDRVRHVGDGVAVIVAESMEEALDAAERVSIVYEPVPAVVGTGSALDSVERLVWEEAPQNLAFHWELGNEALTNDAFLTAPHIIRLDVINNRLVVNPIETRGAAATYVDGRYCLHVASQGVHLIRDMLCDDVINVPRDNLRVITLDVGGGFGVKYFVYPEYALLLWATRIVGRPVKWIASRSESFLSDVQARDHVTHLELALDEEARFVGLRASSIANMGAYLSNWAPHIPTEASAAIYSSVYSIPTIHVKVRGVFTNTVPVDAYRGAGQPEAIYALERIIGKAARELGLTDTEIRRRNYISSERMPYRTALTHTYDSGDFMSNMEKALQIAEVGTFESRRAEAHAENYLLGLGIAPYIEATDGVPDGEVDITVSGDGKVTIISGWQSTGQGHETAFSQMVAQQLGVAIGAIEVIQGDSQKVFSGRGTGGSRSLVFATSALVAASTSIIEKGKVIASDLLEVAENDVSYSEGSFQVVGTDVKLELFEVALEAERRSGGKLAANGVFVPDQSGAYPDAGTSFPNGCHVCELSIDMETGQPKIIRYVAVNDFGILVNPMLVLGQVHGGVAQGIGQAFCENTVYDDTGQLLTGSFMDYCIPRADDLPSVSVSFNELPSPAHPLGIKGCGESGAIVGPVAVMNAALDALSLVGVDDIEMPLSSERIWRAIQSAKAL